MEVYRYLNNYVSKKIRDEGKIIMRKNKLVFYYTLMLKSFFKGNITSSFLFFRELRRYDSFLKITYSFLSNKIVKFVKSTHK